MFKCNDTILHFSTPNTENSASANSYLTQLRFHNFISQDLLEKGLKIRNIEYSKQIIKGDQKNLINQAIEIIDPNGISLVFNDYSGILKRKR